MGADGCSSVPGVGLLALPPPLLVSFSAAEGGRGSKARQAAQAGTSGSDCPARRPARLPGAAQSTWRGGRGLPLRQGGKNNNLQAKKLGAAGSVFITMKKKALFPASPQRLFITHTRVWRKCSICWVQSSTHTAYKLRAFTCRVPEIKHTHTQKREEFCIGPGALPLPGCPCASAPAGAGSRSGIPHYLRPFPASSAGNSSASVFLQPHLESVTPECQPSEPGGWHALPPARSFPPPCLLATLPVRLPLCSGFELPSPESCGAEFYPPSLFGEF